MISNRFVHINLQLYGLPADDRLAVVLFPDRLTLEQHLNVFYVVFVFQTSIDLFQLFHDLFYLLFYLSVLWLDYLVGFLISYGLRLASLERLLDRVLRLGRYLRWLR